MLLPKSGIWVAAATAANHFRTVRRGSHQPSVAVIDHLRDETQAAELGSKLAGEGGITLEDENFGGHMTVGAPARVGP